MNNMKDKTTSTDIEGLRKEVEQVMKRFVTFSSELERKTVADKIMELVELHLSNKSELKKMEKDCDKNNNQ